MAPVDGRPQGLLPGRGVAAPAGEHLEAALQAGQQRRGRQELVRAAASSMARGSPSSREQISATAGAFSFVTWKSGRAATARWMKSATASY